MINLDFILGGAYMYKLQFCNVYSKEVVREANYDNPEIILNLIESEEINNNQENFIFGNDRKTLKADYVNHKVFDKDDVKVYKVFFKVKFPGILARIS
jgi:hypothetical protein